MLQRFHDFIAGQHLFSTREEVLLAVSGGRDSVCMAHLFHRAGLHFAIAHCNFHLRPVDCDRDERFVARLAGQLGVPFFVARFDTRAYAAAHGLGVEEAARRLRYGFFADLCRQHAFGCVATAHHRDDSTETFFLNLFRGTGIEGLHGIRPRSPLAEAVGARADGPGPALVRPLLCFSRAEIDDYVARHRLPFVEDSTNALLDARRNRIRHRLMPLLRELYPSVDATMEANIRRLAEAGEVYARAVAGLREGCLREDVSPFGFRYVWFAVADLLALEPRRTLLFELLRPYGFQPAVADEVAAALPSPRSGALFCSATHRAAFDRGRLLVVPRRPPQLPSLEWGEEPLHDLQRTAHGQPASGSLRMAEVVDADRVRLPLVLRAWRPGDRFCPLGMNRQRRLSDFLKDCKVNLFEKERVGVVADADGRIVWVVGLRIDHRCRVTDATRRCLRLVAAYPPPLT